MAFHLFDAPEIIKCRDVHHLIESIIYSFFCFFFVFAMDCEKNEIIVHIAHRTTAMASSFVYFAHVHRTHENRLPHQRCSLRRIRGSSKNRLGSTRLVSSLARFSISGRIHTAHTHVTRRVFHLVFHRFFFLLFWNSRKKDSTRFRT